MVLSQQLSILKLHAPPFLLCLACSYILSTVCVYRLKPVQPLLPPPPPHLLDLLFNRHPSLSIKIALSPLVVARADVVGGWTYWPSSASSSNVVCYRCRHPYHKANHCWAPDEVIESTNALTLCTSLPKQTMTGTWIPAPLIEPHTTAHSVSVKVSLFWER